MLKPITALLHEYSNVKEQTTDKKGKSVPLQARPRGFQEVKAPRFRDNGTG